MLPFFSRFFNKTMKKQPIRLTPAQAKQKMESEPVTDPRRTPAAGVCPGAYSRSDQSAQRNDRTHRAGHFER